MSVEVLLAKLTKVKPSGQNKWTACCPSHDDRNPSLAVWLLDDGRITVYCSAGCTGAEIMGAVGLSLADLYPNGAIGHQLKGWEQMKKSSEKTRSDSLILAIAEADRAQGKRLSAKDREAELAAYKRSRGAQ